MVPSRSRRIGSRLLAVALLSTTVTGLSATAASAATGDITIDDVGFVEEGDSGTQTVTFTVTREGVVGLGDDAVTVDFATVAGTATAGQDFTATSGQVTFDFEPLLPPGETEQTREIDVEISGDLDAEADESFFVGLTNASEGTIRDGAGEAVIQNDDGPVMSVDTVDTIIAEGETAQFVVSIPAPYPLDVTVDARTFDIVAKAGEDYVAFDAPVTIPAGQTQVEVQVATIDDDIDEGGQRFGFRIDNPRADSGPAPTIGDGFTDVILTDDDEVTLALAGDAEVVEGDDGTAEVVFTIVRQGASEVQDSADVVVTLGTAEEGDLDTSTQTVFIGLSGEQDFSVEVNGDTVSEPDETFTVTLQERRAGSAIDPAGASATGTIRNDDAEVFAGFFRSNGTVRQNLDPFETEGTIGFPITLRHPSVRDTSVDVATEEINELAAQEGEDYVAVDETVTIPAGETEVLVDVTLLDDDIREGGIEAVDIAVSNPVNGTINPTAPGKLQIKDDEPDPTIDVPDQTIDETRAGQTTVQLVATLDTRHESPIRVSWMLEDLTATGGTTCGGGVDYLSDSGEFQFPALSREVSFDVTVCGDFDPEGSEVFLVRFDEASLGDQDGQGERTDATVMARRSAAPITIVEGTEVSVADAQVLESNSGATADLAFDVTLNQASEETVTVQVTTTDGTATVGDDDYTALTGQTVTFAPGETSQQVVVTVTGDDTVEDDEDLTLTLSNPSNAVLGDATATGTIRNDDGTALRVLDLALPELDSGNRNAEVQVRLSNPSDSAVTFDWVAVETGDADQGPDFGTNSGSVTLTPGQTMATLPVLINGDVEREDDETFSVDIANVVGAEVDDPRGEVTIQNDDVEVTLAAVASGTEGDDGDSPDLAVQVLLDRPSVDDVQVAVDVTAGTATLDTDFLAPAATVTVPAGATNDTILVPLVGDDTDEDDEDFMVTISDPTPGDGVTVGAASTSTATIVDDDAPPVLTVVDVEVSEDDGTATFVLALSAASSKPITVDVATQDDTATAGDDYVALATTTITFAPGDITADVVVDLVDDDVNEATETFLLALTNPSDTVSLGDPSSTATITDDDGVTVSLGAIDPVVETDSSAAATVEVVLDRASVDDVVVTLDTTDGTATAGDDYVALVDRSVTVLAGQTSATTTVAIVGDGLAEDDETFSVAIDGVTGAAMGWSSSVTATITDDDEVRLRAADVEVSEDVGDTSFAVLLDADDQTAGDQSHTGPVQVTVGIAGDTATIDQDVTAAASTTVTIEAGQTSATVPVSILQDTVDEEPETVDATLSAPGGAAIEDGEATMTIVDDDVTTVGIADATVVEGDTGTTDLIFTVTVDADPVTPGAQGVPRDASVNFRTTSDTATVGGDVEATAGILQLPAGSTAVDLVVRVNGDTDDERDERFQVRLDAPVGVVLGDATANGTIRDDDDAVVEPEPEDEDEDEADTGVVTRSAGLDRIATAIQASQDHWPSNTSRTDDLTGAAGGAVLTRADDFPDALAGGPLAASLDAPLLLTASDELDPRVETELARLGVDEVTVLGGEVAISTPVQFRLEELGYTVTRIAGATRFDTAALVARRLGLPDSGEVVVALGSNPVPSRAWPDALSAGSLAASPDGVPVLLTQPNDLPEETAATIRDLGADTALLLGGPVAVSRSVVTSLDGVVDDVVRLAGPDRYATSVEVARNALARFPDGNVDVVFATGANFPDGLAAGAVAARRGAVVLLVPPTGLTVDSTTIAFLEEFAERIDDAVLIGGPVAVDEPTRLLLEQAIIAD